METTNERTADDIYFDLSCCEFCGKKLEHGTVHMTETRWGNLDICLSCALGQVGTIEGYETATETRTCNLCSRVGTRHCIRLVEASGCDMYYACCKCRHDIDCDECETGEYESEAAYFDRELSNAARGHGLIASAVGL